VDEIIINFTPNQVAPTSVTNCPKTGKTKLNIKLPVEYRRGRIMGVLDHEIGSHYLRRHNERFQTWYKKREKFEVKNNLFTEEGFACTNQLCRQALDPNKRPFLYRSAVNYYCAYKASKCSFVECFDDLAKYIDDKNNRWKFICRVKRGTQDTSLPGGFYRDQTYLKGAVAVLSNRRKLNLPGLMCGKICFDTLKRLDKEGSLNYESNLMPPFMKDMD
jgi:hypothetical protein